jgi:AcrR family transcriptional regulator
MTTTVSPGPRQKYHHGDLRDALISATQQLIEENGIDNFSVSDACRLAGVSTAAPYKHFKSKDEMVVAAILKAMESHAQDMQRVLSEHPKGSLDRIVALGENYIETALREPQMFRLRFAHVQEDIAPEISEIGRLIYGQVQEEIRAVLGEDSINERVRERSYMLWSLVHGMSYLAMVPDFADKRPEASRDVFLRDVAARVLATDAT